MSSALPASESPGPCCARHPQTAASGSCIRCGNFMCNGCQWRTRLDAHPLCAACWELREVHRKTLPGAEVPGRTGLWLGVASLLPLPPVQLVSLVLNLVELLKAEPVHRWRSIVGLGLTLLGLLGLLLLVLGL